MKNFIFILISVLALNLGFSSKLQAKDGDTFNLTTPPLSLFLGIYSLGLDVKITDQFTLGPVLGYYSDTSQGVKVKVYELGVRGNWFINKPVFNSSWYLGPSIAYVGTKASEDKVNVTLNLWALTVLGGYHWFWDSGFNLGLGAGFTHINWPDYVTVNGKRISFSQFEETTLALEFKLGYSF